MPPSLLSAKPLDLTAPLGDVPEAEGRGPRALGGECTRDARLPASSVLAVAAVRQLAHLGSGAWKEEAAPGSPTCWCDFRVSSVRVVPRWSPSVVTRGQAPAAHLPLAASLLTLEFSDFIFTVCFYSLNKKTSASLVK